MLARFKIYQILILVVILLQSCKKDEDGVHCPPQQHYVLGSLAYKFNFKPQSSWYFKKIGTSVTNVISVNVNTNVQVYKLTGTSKECFDGGTTEILEVGCSHDFFSGGYRDLDYRANYDGIYSGYNPTYQITPKAILTNENDSIVYKNSFYCKLEQLSPSEIINGSTYSNVYKMMYSPDLFGFKRIWWCPNIGFVRLESYNTSTSQLEIWELDSCHVQLY